MMNPEQAFLHAILDAPDDDGPRLMYADWLTERDDPRGEFIRVQCELAKMEPDDDHRPDLQDREHDLLTEQGDTWARTVTGLVEEHCFRRGFIEDVCLDAMAFLEHGETLFRRTPVRRLGLRRLTNVRDADWGTSELVGLLGLDLSFTGIEPGQLQAILHGMRSPRLHELRLASGSFGTTGLRVLAGHPVGKRLTLLDLSANRLSGLGRALAVSVRFPQLTNLNLSGNSLSSADAESLAGASNLTRLRALSLNRNYIDADGLRALAPSLAGLHELRLAENRFGAEAAEVVASAFPNLRLLELGWANLGAAGWRALAASPNLARLHTLDLLRTAGGPDGAKALAESPHLTRLVYLNLHDCGIKDTGAKAVANSPAATRLRVLLLQGNEIGGPGVRALLTSPHLSRLRWVDLGRNFIGDPTAEIIAASPNVARLRELDLSGNRIGPTGAAALAASPHLARLTRLNLGGNPIGNEGVRALANSPHLARLTELTLGSVPTAAGVSAVVGWFGSPAAKALLESPYLTRLKRVMLGRCDVTLEERQALRARFGLYAVGDCGEQVV